MARSMQAKDNAIDILDKQLALRAKKNQYGIIVVSSATEPYLQIEPEQQLTRRVLERILHYRFPVHIITRSDLVTRDFDILREINEVAIIPPDLQNILPAKALITFSFSTLDDDIAHIFEPGATPPSKRLECLETTLANGFHCGVSLMPLLPYITDTEEAIERFYSTFSKAGVRYMFPASITLFGYGPAASKTITLRAIAKYFPQLAESYNNLFASGYQTDRNYHKAFVNRIAAAQRKYGMPDRILLP
jgi:DNA repair photolyase